MQERQAKNERAGKSRENAVKNKLQMQAAAAEKRGMTLEDYIRKRDMKGGRLDKSKSRRQKKVGSRAKVHAAKEDEMDIG